MSNRPAHRLGPGEALEHVGVLVACEPGAGPVRGLTVRVGGSALQRGLVQATRARARPWSARLAPWEASAWEHTFEPSGRAGELSCTLRGARVADDRASLACAPGASLKRVRNALAHAVWVQLDAVALRPGAGALWLSVVPTDGSDREAVERVVSLEVVEAAPPDAVTLYVGWSAPPEATALRAHVDAIARAVATQPPGARVTLASGTEARRIFVRPGCVVLGDRGARGDARFRALWQRWSAGALERLTLAPPGGTAAGAQGLELVLARRGRYAPGPTELVCTLARESGSERARGALLAGFATVLEDADAVHGFVAEHRWMPSMLDRTPWDADTAVTVASLRARGRVDPRAAWAVRLAPDAAAAWCDRSGFRVREMAGGGVIAHRAG